MNSIIYLTWLITISTIRPTNSASRSYHLMEIGYCGSIFQEVVTASETVCSIICSRIPSCVGFGFDSSTEQIKKFSLLDEIFSPYENGNQSCNVSDYAVGKPISYATRDTVLYTEASCFSEYSTNDPTTTTESILNSGVTSNDSTTVLTITTTVSTNSSPILLTTSQPNSSTSDVQVTTTSYNPSALSVTSSSTTVTTTTLSTSATTKTTTPNPCSPLPHPFYFSNFSISYAFNPSSGTVQCPSGSVITGVGISTSLQFVAGTCVTLGVPNTTTLNSYNQSALCGKLSSSFTFISAVATAVAYGSTFHTHTCSPLSNGWAFGTCMTDTKSSIAPTSTPPTPAPNGTLTTSPANWILCPQGNSSGLWAMSSVFTFSGNMTMTCRRIFL